MINDRGIAVGGIVYATEYGADAAYPSGFLVAGNEYLVTSVQDPGGTLTVEGSDAQFMQLFFETSPPIPDVPVTE